jgi:hypothetical protein
VLSLGQSWAADETSAPWLSGWSDELEGAVELLPDPDDCVSDDSVSDSCWDEDDVVSEDPVLPDVPVLDESVPVVLVVGAVKGEPATAKAAPPMTSTVTQAMTMASCFFMPGPIARNPRGRYRTSRI